MIIDVYSIGDIDVASFSLQSCYLFSKAEEFRIVHTRPFRYSDAVSYDVVRI